MEIGCEIERHEKTGIERGCEHEREREYEYVYVYEWEDVKATRVFPR